MLSDDFLHHISTRLSALEHKNIQILKAAPVAGGDINHAYRLDSKEKTFFLKNNLAKKYPGMFEAESRGIHLLQSSGCLPVPEVLEYGTWNDQSYLILMYIHQAPRKSNYWEALGSGLAQLHYCSQEAFGLDHHNYIGSLRQLNHCHATWPEFFIEERLKIQVALARKKGMISSRDHNDFEQLYKRLPSIFPEEPPALLHGDLWGGNHMTGPDGEPVIIDPAVYYGHREMDIAMTRLFGGFDDRFYLAYQKTYPLEPGWKNRTDICNLYPLLVHVNLFGQTYMHSVRSILKRFESSVF